MVFIADQEQEIELEIEEEVDSLNGSARWISRENEWNSNTDVNTLKRFHATNIFGR